MDRGNKIKEEMITQAKTFEELLDIEYGLAGTASRVEFDAEAAAFCLSISNITINAPRSGKMR